MLTPEEFAAAMRLFSPLDPIMDNKALWKRAFTTDPKAVKPITGKQYKGNSPKPYWLIERATEEFGPAGIGWGVTVKSERFERLSETDVLHVAVVSIWYVLDGKRSETLEQMGGTKAAYMTSSGKMSIDEDAGKKSVTDGMVKCLSMLGFAGDIFSGMWDDSKYVEWAGFEYRRREVEADPEEKRRAELEALALAIVETFDAGNEWAAYEEYAALPTNEDKLVLWSILKPNSRVRSAIKRIGAEETAKQKALDAQKVAA